MNQALPNTEQAPGADMENTSPTIIPFPNAVKPDAKDGEAWEGTVKGKIIVADGKMDLAIDTINGEMVGNTEDGATKPDSEQTVDEALSEFMKGQEDQGAGVQ